MSGSQAGLNSDDKNNKAIYMTRTQTSLWFSQKFRKWGAVQNLQTEQLNCYTKNSEIVGSESCVHSAMPTAWRFSNFTNTVLYEQDDPGKNQTAAAPSKSKKNASQLRSKVCVSGKEKAREKERQMSPIGPEGHD